MLRLGDGLGWTTALDDGVKDISNAQTGLGRGKDAHVRVDVKAVEQLLSHVARMSIGQIAFLESSQLDECERKRELMMMMMMIIL